MIQEAKEKSDDPTIKNLADVCMEWANGDLKTKEFSPLAPSKEQAEEK
jgi:hypothetical protein